MQGHSHQIWSGKVRSVCVKNAIPWANTILLGGKTTEFHMNIYPFCTLCRTLVLYWCRLSEPVCLSVESHTLRMVRLARFASKNGIRTETCWEKHSPYSSVAFLAAIMQVSTWYLCQPVCLRALRARSPSNGANWRRQASIE